MNETAQELTEKIRLLFGQLSLDTKRARIAELERQCASPLLWSDQKKAALLTQELAHLTEEVSTWEALAADAHALTELEESGDASLNEELRADIQALSGRLASLEVRTFFSGKHDVASALISIHAGTGGVDAMDWAEMLVRMYVRFCEHMAWKVRILDEQRGGEAGVKSVAFEVEGRYAYGYLKAEHGVHRLVRISPFDAEGMRHTSFALVDVVPDLGEVSDVSVRSEDLRIDVFRASGHGGQSVNTTDSAVRITHLPTGIVVSCQNERSQQQNKETALRYLTSKLQYIAETSREEEKKAARGSHVAAAWGNQIRSYVLNPYRLVKDHRTEHETSDVQDVLDGNLLPFIEATLRSRL